MIIKKIMQLSNENEVFLILINLNFRKALEVG
jgi:hypothetical protein